jgi:hypothetical protein
MKFLCPTLAAAVALLAGCGDHSKTTQGVNAVSNVVNAPANYLTTVVQAQQHADKVIDVSYINQAIQLFQVSEGRLPKNLQELVPNYISKVPAAPLDGTLVYDATAGMVKVENVEKK